MTPATVNPAEASALVTVLSPATVVILMLTNLFAERSLSSDSLALTLPLSLVMALASMTMATAAARPIATLLRSFVVRFLLLVVFATLCGMAATMSVGRACKHLEGSGRYPLG